MSFTTPRPDMTNRLPKRMALGVMRTKTGRPSNGEPERIRTIAWFNAVAISLGEQRPGTIGRLMQKESDARGLSQNHATTTVQRDGTITPKEWIKRINQLL